MLAWQQRQQRSSIRTVQDASRQDVSQAGGRSLSWSCIIYMDVGQQKLRVTRKRPKLRWIPTQRTRAGFSMLNQFKYNHHNYKATICILQLWTSIRFPLPLKSSFPSFHSILKWCSQHCKAKRGCFVRHRAIAGHSLRLASVPARLQVQMQVWLNTQSNNKKLH